MIHLMIFLFVIIVTAVIFTGWIIGSIIRFIWHAVTGSSRPITQNTGGRICANPACGANNPAEARFCRRCGANLMHPANSGRHAVQI